MPERPIRPEVLAAAMFVVEALGPAEDAGGLADDLVLVEDTPPTTTMAVGLDSADGVVAFLVYVYDLAATDEQGATGNDLFARGVATLSEAERLDAPGPRAVASGEVGSYGLLLATTPMLYERLGGGHRRARDRGEPVPVAGPWEASEAGETAALAEALLASLRETNRLAENYLRATNTPGQRSTSEESELALFLTDGRSLTPLLTLIRRVVEGVETSE